MNKIDFNKLKIDLHKSINNITILPHMNPDGDAIGSSLAMFLYLTKLKQNVKLIIPTDYSDFLKWLPESEKIISLSKKNKIFINKWIQSSNYIFLLDFNNISRIYPLDLILNKSNGIKVMIDHHIDPPQEYFDFMFFDPLSPSTTVLIFKFIEKMEDLKLIDKKIATCLYTGIITDTGFFRYSSVTPETHIIVSKLLAKNINISNINRHLFAIYTKNRMKLLGKALQELKTLPDYRTAYMIISSKDIIFYNCSYNDTEGFVNYGLKIKNIVLSVIFIEDIDSNMTKISFRSRGKFDVNVLAKEYFQGGGHKNASGGRIKINILNIEEYFLKVLSKYKKQLNAILI